MFWFATALTGGTATALDFHNGSKLSDGDGAFAFSGGAAYFYILDADSGLSESSPDVIAPDVNAGTKRWILQAVYFDTIGIGVTTPTSALQVTGTFDTTPPAAGFAAGTSGTYGALALAGSSGGFIDFAVGDNTAFKGRILYATSNNSMRFYCNGAESARILPSGVFLVGAQSQYGTEKLGVNGNIYASGDVSALTFTDRTPFYEGDALTEIAAIRGSDGEIDHDSLPSFARKDHIIRTQKAGTAAKEVASETEYDEVIEPGRDIGAMVSVLTVGIQQLIEINTAQKTEIAALSARITALETK